MNDRVVVVGAGIAGLCAAMALAGRREVLLLERDGPPPDGDAHAVFADWKRRGVGHLRHSHAFLARLRNLIRDEHPALLQALLDAGCREIRFADALSPQQTAQYRPEPGDDDLTVLTSRRTTLESVMRRYVESLPGVTLRPNAFVKGLRLAKDETGAPVVTGVEVARDDGGVEVIESAAVVDAAGRLSGFAEALAEAGAPSREETETAGILYYTRHYRLLPGQSEPARDQTANGDLGYIKSGIFPADNGCFSVTLAVPEAEATLRQGLMRPETFDAACAALPNIARWTDPERSEPVGKVHGMGDLFGRWRTWPGGLPAGYFPVGDAVVRTNPLYGRGCSFAAVGGVLLREALATSGGPKAQAEAFAAGIERELRPYFDDMRRQDRTAIRRAEAALSPGRRRSVRARAMKSFAEDAVAVALRRDVNLMRQAMRAFHMLEPPNTWLAKPGNMGRVLATWVTPKAFKASAYPQNPGPKRDALFARLGLDAQADMIRA